MGRLVEIGGLAGAQMRGCWGTQVQWVPGSLFNLSVLFGQMPNDEVAQFTHGCEYRQ